MSVIDVNAAVRELDCHEDLFLRFDWDRRLDRQLVDKSQQDHIIKYEPDDTDVVFASVRDVREWRRHCFSNIDPMLVWLGTAANELAGIAWIENAHTAKEYRMLGVRVYEGFENRGYGTMLAETVHDMYGKQAPFKETRFTMRIDNNAAFVIGAVKLGYKLLGENGSFEMVKMSRRLTPAIQTYVRDQKR